MAVKEVSITAKSTADAEFIASATSIDEGVWIHKVDHNLHQSSLITQAHYMHTKRLR